ncbi:MAG: exonuclease domain-containing protein [Bacteroidales bacterium]|jgi:DNA polymerase-3 subunit epsilon|nr:exonuclease domain-containing protein [Bacteroidales bacterium]
MYAILDIETTGGSPKVEKITEIAVFFFNGEKVVDEWSTLINPEKNIPHFITGLTGISNEMVADAPKFYEIAKELVERTEGCIVVGHNVNFDYGFIKSEFNRLGFEYNRETMCTVKLSKKIIPGHKSYSLGKICAELGIEIKGRHRAAGDALATVELFELLQKTSESKGGSIDQHLPSALKYKNLNGNLSVADIESLPDKAGTYYFYDERNTLLYIGKSISIKKRVLSHLGNNDTKRAMEMHARIASISFDLTGSELIALLKESEEIKNNKPLYNRTQRRSLSHWGLYEDMDQFGYTTLKLAKVSDMLEPPVTAFNNKSEARETLSKLVEKHWLCQKLCGLYVTDGACFHFGIRQCNGACVQQEAVKDYNKRVEELLSKYKLDQGNMLIIDQGRNPNERSIIRIEKGMYLGYGYISIDEGYLGIDQMLDCVNPALDNRDVRQILSSWLRKNKVEKILYY